MPLVNRAKKEINAKIVYFGPESAGKATSLNHIFGKLKESCRGAFKAMNLQDDRMLFFDFVPSGQGTLHGYTIRFHIYTITGGVARPSSWKMVLKGVDGVVFVADSDPARMEANLESLRLLDSCLGAYGKSLADIPCVIQCNKRDRAEAAPLEEMGRALNPRGSAMIPSVARTGEGVLESVFNLAKMVMKSLRASGLELDRQADQLHGMAPPAPAEHLEATAGEMPALPPGNLSSKLEEPVVEFSGTPEVLEKGRVRLPLSIRYGGKEKNISLDISLFQDRD